MMLMPPYAHFSDSFDFVFWATCQARPQQESFLAYAKPSTAGVVKPRRGRTGPQFTLVTQVDLWVLWEKHPGAQFSNFQSNWGSS